MRTASFLTVLTVLGVGLGTTAFAQDALFTMRRPSWGGPPDPVSFMVYVLDVNDIDAHAQIFTANVNLRLRWKDERLAHDEESAKTVPLTSIWNPQVILSNRAVRTRAIYPEVALVQPDGTVLFRQQYIGQFTQKLDLTDFPLDTQRFRLHFFAVGFSPDEVEFRPEVIESEGDPIVGGQLGPDLSLPDWRILDAAAEPRPFAATESLSIAGFAFEFTAERLFGYYLLHVILPLLLIAMMSWAPFFIDPNQASLQFSIASSAVLTLIAYRLVVANLLPRLPYLTRLDILTLGATMLVFGAFLQVLVTSHLAHTDRRPRAVQIDRACRVVFPLLFVGLIVVSLAL